MKVPKFHLPQLVLGCILTAMFFACSKNEDSAEETSSWVAKYENVSLGAQDNYSLGHFFKPQTGESIALANVAGQEQKLAMLFFTESGGQNTFLTFPADGTAASTFGTKDIRQFTQANVGINFWESEKMVSGMIYEADMTALEFDHLADGITWGKFDDTFIAQNNGKSDLSYKLSYELNPKAGDVYLIQFDGVIRGIICIRGVVGTSLQGGSIRFDALIEAHDKYEKNKSAKNLMPLSEYMKSL
jgi:hypothetical protein